MTDTRSSDSSITSFLFHIFSKVHQLSNSFLNLYHIHVHLRVAEFDTRQGYTHGLPDRSGTAGTGLAGSYQEDTGEAAPTRSST